MPTMSIQNADLFYKEQGSGSPILLIHSTGANADMWGSAFESLATRNRVIAYDRRGFSRSAQLSLGDLHQHAEDVAALLRHLHATPATLVGSDTGGVIALDVAVHHPELVAAVVLCEVNLHLRKQQAISGFFERARLRYLNRAKGARAAAEAYYMHTLEEKSGESGFERLAKEWREALLANAEASLREIEAGTGEHLTTQQIAGISQPVTCLVSTRSHPFYREVAQQLARELPKMRSKIVTATGHYMHLDQPSQFVHEIAEALPGQFKRADIDSYEQRARQNHRSVKASSVPKPR
ncbi:alpha/beta fold hydrolase [Ktedonospora formicarum]|uniref:Hydrolase n=1 Tax=Ktedonospora formicarum TaxID=2778364 RepID=A0A8J3HZ72_9CHLR|nr:alpha/beta hydrolase [Ktedonospora formicarum]GHO43830.1 hydrolase [Ktedonospora formicarum]